MMKSGSPEKKKKKMTLKEVKELGPIQKYRHYGKFPWKLMLHFLLAIITSVQCMIMIRSTFSHTRAEVRYFYFWFMDPNGTYSDVKYDTYKYFFKMDELRDLVKFSRDNYYSAETNSIEGFINVRKDGDIIPIKGELVFLEDAFDERFPMKFKVTETDLSYFDEEKYNNTVFRDIINRCKEIQLTYVLQSVVEQTDYCSVDCFEWHILQQISFEHFSHAVEKLTIRQQACDYAEKYEWSRHLWIHLLVLLVAGGSAYLSWKYLFDILYITRKEKRGEQHRDRVIENDMAAYAIVQTKNEKYLLESSKGPFKRAREDPATSSPMKKKVQLSSFAKDFKKKLTAKSGYTINKWNVVCLIGNVVQLSGVFIYMFDGKQRLTSTNAFFGLGCFLAWVNIARYLEYSRLHYLMFNTLFTSLPTSARFLTAVMPVFLGYAFLGTALFWKLDRFKTPARAMITEFSLFLGDSVFDIFREVTYEEFWLGQLYLYTFLIMFFTIVQNFFISIIQYTYFSLENLEKKRAKMLDDGKQGGSQQPQQTKSPAEQAKELEQLQKEIIAKNKEWSMKISQLSGIQRTEGK